MGLPESPKGGFSFENCRRNEFLLKQGFPCPKSVKTGTTIAGFIFKDGVILGLILEPLKEILLPTKTATNCTTWRKTFIALVQVRQLICRYYPADVVATRVAPSRNRKN